MRTTPEYRINSDPEESEFFLIERTVEDGVFTEGVKLSSPYKEEIEKIVTLYEQHFKMLEALKHLTANGGLIKAVYDAGENSLLFESYEKALQTIKECEL